MDTQNSKANKTIKPQFSGECKQMKLGELCTPKQWKSLKQSDMTEAGYPVYGANGIIGFYHEYNHPNETILVGCRGTCGEVNTCQPESYVTSNAMCLDNLADCIDMGYLACFLKAYDFRKKIGGTSQPQITKSSISSIDVPVYPLDVQLAIRSKLEAVLNKIDYCRRAEEHLSSLVKSRFIEMFGDPVENDSKLPKCKWEDVLTIVNGKNQKKVECATGEYPICGSGGEMGRARQYLTKGDSVIIGRKGNINNPILMREPFWNVDTAFGLEPNADILRVEYLYYFCEWFDFQQLNKAVTIPSLTKADLLKIEMPLPPLPLQQEFADFASQVDKLRFKTQQQIEKLEMLKASLMQEYFE